MNHPRVVLFVGLLTAAVVLPSSLIVTGLGQLGPTGSFPPSSGSNVSAATTTGTATRAPHEARTAVTSAGTDAADTGAAAIAATTTAAAVTSPTEATSVGSVVSTAAAPDAVPAGSIGARHGWQLVFADEFDGIELDAISWARCYWWSESGCTNASNGEQQWYVPEAVHVADGTLRLTARRQAAVGAGGERFEYTSGIVSGLSHDADLRAFTYGYFEIRARVPSGRGLWPAFWMLPTSRESEPEIDIMEALGQEPDSTLMYFHWRAADGTEASTGQWWQGSDMSAGWHTYAVRWEIDRLTWYVDGVPRLELTVAQVPIPAEPMYLLLDLAVGGDFATEPDADTPFPATFEIDYVRVWRES